MKVEYTRHGGAYDRGSADKYYGRDFNPHYFVGDSLSSLLVTKLTSEERAAYEQGYNEQTDSKDWGDLS
jgi:hypothetical protein